MNITQTALTALLITTTFFETTFCENFPKATQTYQQLQRDPQGSPFVVSFGTSMSQTHDTNNTCHPSYIRFQLQKLAQKSSNPQAFLADTERIWYVLNALPTIICTTCSSTTAPGDLDLVRDQKIVHHIITDLAAQTTADSLTVTKCPSCSSASIRLEDPKLYPMTDAKRQAMVDQIDYLNLKQQKGCIEHGIPPYRLSIEACDIMTDGGIGFDHAKVASQAAWLKKLGNPFICLHHYSNPAQIPNLFDKKEHIAWFAEYAKTVATASPEIRYYCPISQPMAFSQRVIRKTLPPFDSALSQQELFGNIIDAHIAAYDAIKSVNPQAQIFISHQWKPMIPMHSGLHPWYPLERLVCAIANRMYNQAFVDQFKKHSDKFDGIALSVYPPIYFNGWIPVGHNCSGKIDAVYSLECIEKMHAAFPGKQIAIIETGCNNPSPEIRRSFMDMTLDICAQARAKGAEIIGVYFWGHTNNPAIYREWNTPRRDKHFGMFEDIDPSNPAGSINPAGEYLKEIAQTK